MKPEKESESNFLGWWPVVWLRRRKDREIVPKKGWKSRKTPNKGLVTLANDLKAIFYFFLSEKPDLAQILHVFSDVPDSERRKKVVHHEEVPGHAKPKKKIGDKKSAFTIKAKIIPVTPKTVAASTGSARKKWVFVLKLLNRLKMMQTKTEVVTAWGERSATATNLEAPLLRLMLTYRRARQRQHGPAWTSRVPSSMRTSTKMTQSL